MQAISSLGQTSTWLPVTQKYHLRVRHWSVSLLDICIRPSHSVGTHYHHQYAGDTTLLVAQHSSMDTDQEYNNVCSWSTQNKLSINTDKTKVIIFHHPAARNLCIPPPMPGIERVKQVALVGIDVTNTLSTAAYVDRQLMQVNLHLYLLSLFQSSCLQRSLLHLLFSAVVINKLTYALPVYAGQLLPMEKNRKMLYQQRPCAVDFHSLRLT